MTAEAEREEARRRAAGEEARAGQLRAEAALAEMEAQAVTVPEALRRVLVHLDDCSRDLLDVHARPPEQVIRLARFLGDMHDLVVELLRAQGDGEGLWTNTERHYAWYLKGYGDGSAEWP